jgi:hypothetical protein
MGPAAIQPRFRRDPEPRGRSLPSHQRRAGLGVWSASRRESGRRAIKAWKRNVPFDPATLAVFADAVAGLVREWSAVLPPGSVMTIPPQGASAPGPYAAEALGSAVAEARGLPFAALLVRTDPKRWHGVRHALRQALFVATLPDPPPSLVIIVDDLVTTGSTMRRSLQAIRAERVAAFGFSFSGC